METISGSSSLPDEEPCSFIDAQDRAAPLEIRENLFGFEVIDVEGWLFLKGIQEDEHPIHIADAVSLAERLVIFLESRGAKDEIPKNILDEALAEARTDITDSRTVRRAIVILKKHWKYGEILDTAYHRYYSSMH